MNIIQGSSLLGGKEAVICCQWIILKFHLELWKIRQKYKSGLEIEIEMLWNTSIACFC